MISEPVIQLEQLLAPIAGENPAGQDLNYTVWRDLQNLRRESDSFGEAKPVPWAAIVTTATSALNEKTKDVRIASYLAEAIVKEYGLAGLRDGLRLLRGLLEAFWEPIYPASRNGSFAARASALGLINEKLSLAAKQTSLTQTTVGEQYSYLQWEESEKFRIPANLEDLSYDEKERIKELRERAANEKKITSEDWASAVRGTSPERFATAYALLEEGWKEFSALDQLMDKVFTHVHPGLEEFKQAIDEAAAATTPDREALRRAFADAEEELEDADGLGTFKDDFSRLLKQEKLDPNALKRIGNRLIVREAPSLEGLKKTFEVMRDLLRPLLQAEPTTQKVVQPTPKDEPEKPKPEPSPTSEQPKSAPKPQPPDGIGDRQKALARLVEVAAYFREAEPYNPAGNLIERAVSWGNLSLAQWLAEVIEPDKLSSVQERLGINISVANDQLPNDEQPPNKLLVLGKTVLSALSASSATEQKSAAISSNGFKDRRDAIATLTEVAKYFRQAEPHNPAICLVERAIAWSDMSLEQWLAQIIEDKDLLSRLHARLEIKPDGQEQ